MATKIKAELSEKSKYYVDKHRHYELKHFCLQYPEWKRLHREIDGIARRSTDNTIFSKSTVRSDLTAIQAEKRIKLLERIELIEKTAMSADPYLASYILKAVTEGLSFNQLKSRLEIPCGRDMYYDRYRRFFWLLDRARN